MISTSKIEWEKDAARLHKTIRLGKNSKGLYNKVTISADLIDSAAWREGDSIWLYCSGNTLFKLSNEKSDIKLRKSSRTSKALAICNMSFAQTIHGRGQADEYDAWVDGTDIIFTPKREA